MKNKLEILKVFLLIGFASICLAEVQVRTVFAKSTTEIQADIVDKAVFQGVYKCYTNDHVVSSLDSLTSYTGISSLMKGSTNGNYVPLITGVDSVISSNRYSVADSGLSCAQLFEGGSYSFGGANGSILTATGHTAPSLNQTTAVVEFMTNMGYDVATPDTSNQCYTLQYTSGANATVRTTNKVCQKPNGDLYTEGSSTGTALFSVTSKKICLNHGSAGQSVGCTDAPAQLTTVNLLESVIAICGGYTCTGRRVQGEPEYEFTFQGVASDPQSSLTGYSAKFKNNDSATAALQAINFLSDGKYSTYDSSSSGIKFSDLEKRVLYQAYLTSYYNVGVNCAEGAIETSATHKVEWFDDGAMKTCYTEDISKASNKNKPVNGIDGDGLLSYESIKKSGSKTAVEVLLDELGALRTDYTDEEIEEMNGIINGDIEGADGGTSCASSGGAKNLGWIICSVLEVAQDVTTGLYEDYIEPKLVIDARLFSSSSEATRTAWGTFQTIANVLFIIALLAIIFSQLTGIGIDNYGIKKMLPKLVLAALLVNLSYYICVIFIDLSNIVGSSVQNIFASLNPGTMKNLVINGESYTPGSGTAGSTALNVVALIGGLGALGLAIWSNPLILVSFLLSVLSALIALFFLFILLSAREALIVVLTVLSPLAFVCYMLPNTRKLFDKWLKIYEGLLLVYPICGLLVGGGDYVSKLLLASGIAGDGFAAAFSAMMVGILPIFAIPTVLKSSFAAVGNIGTKISAFGARTASRASTGAGRAINNSRVVKAGIETYQRRREAGINNRTVRRLSGRTDLTDAQKSRLALATAALAKNEEQEANSERLTSRNYLENRRAGREEKERVEREDDIIAGIMRGEVIQDGVNQGDVYDRGKNSAAIMERYITLANKADKTQDERDEQSALLRVAMRDKVTQKGMIDLVYNRQREEIDPATGKNLNP